MGYLIKELFEKGAMEVTLEDLQRLIDLKKEENYKLEYKARDFVNQPEKLSRVISAFLNSEGGLIILGMREDDPDKKERLQAKIYPEKIELLDLSSTRERVEQIVASNIFSSIRPYIEIVPVRSSEGSVFLIEIPRGDNPPYQAADGKYYKRLNSTIYHLHHSEILDFLGKRRKPVLGVIFTITADSISHTPEGHLQFKLNITIVNCGSSIGKHNMFVSSFDGTEIFSTNFQRIDSLRRGKPSVQWTDNTGVLYPDVRLATHIGEIVLKTKQTVNINYSLICEDMERFEEVFDIPLSVLEAFLKMKADGKNPEFNHSSPHVLRAMFPGVGTAS